MVSPARVRRRFVSAERRSIDDVGDVVVGVVVVGCFDALLVVANVVVLIVFATVFNVEVLSRYASIIGPTRLRFNVV